MVQNGPKLVQNVSNIPNSSKLVLTCPNSSEWVRTAQDRSGRVGSGRVRTHPNLSLIQLNLTPKYYIQSPLPLPATLFQRPLDNFYPLISTYFVDYYCIYNFQASIRPCRPHNFLIAYTEDEPLLPFICFCSFSVSFIN